MEFLKNAIKSIIDRTPFLNQFIIFKGINAEKQIALTFDDGPDPEKTPRLLQILKEKGVKATFFLLGSEVEKYPEVARAILQDGHVVGNHTYSHQDFDGISNQEALAEIQKGFDILRRVLNQDQIKLLRSPKGDLRWRLLPALIKQKICLVFWSVDPKDFEVKDAEIIRKRLLEHHYQGGEIILLHDTVEATIDMIDSLIDTLQKKGLQFVTIPHLCRKRQKRNILSLRAFH